MSNINKLISGLMAFSLLFVVASPALATQVKEKVAICHTGNGTNWEDIEVDKDAWDEHESAHSDHELDFLITENNPCPPVEEEPVDVCPNIDGDQAVLPDNMYLEEGLCVEIVEETPEATPSATPTETPKAPILPQTGGGMDFVWFGLAIAAIAGGVKYLVRNKD